VKRFYQKIDIEKLKRFLVCSEGDSETQIVQQRILEFLEQELADFRKIG
jgi:hypothetical protein